MNYISEYKVKIIEGELRCAALAEYMNKLNTPKKVWISEDGSSVVERVEYDPKTNQLVGLVLPFGKNGMPIPFSFLATSAEDIQKYIDKKKSRLIYFVMAQPLKENTPPFLLSMFGTDNKFEFKNVLQRWKFMERELQK